MNVTITSWTWPVCDVLVINQVRLKSPRESEQAFVVVKKMGTGEGREKPNQQSVA